MTAWFYHKGQLQPIKDTHPDVGANVLDGKARLRYHDTGRILAVQARSLHLCRQGIAAVLEREAIRPARINAEWPGHFVDCPIGDWK